MNILKLATETLDEILWGAKKTTPGFPHIADGMDLKRYMGTVILALLPTTAAGIYFFGYRVILMIGVSYVAGGLTEVLFATVQKKEIHEGFLVTGLIFPLILPPGLPLWVVALGSIFGVVFGKEFFGGTGRNIFNPALVGRVFITLSFPQLFAGAWLAPGGAVTAATPLIRFRSEKVIASYLHLLFGQTGGSVGEVFRIGIIAGGLFLIALKVIDWRIPLSYLFSVAFISGIGNVFLGQSIAPPGFQLLSGGLLLGAFFMATDPVTSPFTVGGKWIGGILMGLLTVLIRAFSGYPEGVMFSILILNAVTPLVDQLIVNSRYPRHETT